MEENRFTLERFESMEYTTDSSFSGQSVAKNDSISLKILLSSEFSNMLVSFPEILCKNEK